jgi:hypothetical protein
MLGLVQSKNGNTNTVILLSLYWVSASCCVVTMNKYNNPLFVTSKMYLFIVTCYEQRIVVLIHCYIISSSKAELSVCRLLALSFFFFPVSLPPQDMTFSGSWSRCTYDSSG